MDLLQLKTTLLGFYVLVGLTTVVMGLSDHARMIGVKEYCSSEAFDVSCNENEAIMMQSAIYGRMQPGRCISDDYGHSLGCYSDILNYFDAKCSGQQSCKVVIGSLDAVAQPCPKDFKSYLEASFVCIPVAPAQPHMCQPQHVIHLSPEGGYIGLQTLQETGAYLNDCIWSLEVKDGQSISFTVFSFMYGQARGTRTGKNTQVQPGSDTFCSWYLSIREEGTVVLEHNLCISDMREMEIYRSKGQHVEMFVIGTSNLDSLPPFLLEYKASGCPDVSPPESAWVKRDGDNLVIRCNNTGETWYLTCKDEEWVGEYSNCTGRTLPANRSNGKKNFLQEAGVAFAVIVGIALGLVIGTSLLAIVFTCRKRCLTQRHALPSNKDLYGDKYDYVGYMHDHSLGGARECEYSHVWEIQSAPYTGMTAIKDTDPGSDPRSPSYKFKDNKNLPGSPKRELPAVPKNKTQRIYERSHSGQGPIQLQGQGSIPVGTTSGYQPRPGGPVYFELEHQQQHSNQNSYSA